MLKVAYIAMWRNGVVTVIRDIPATGIVAMDIVATTAIPIIGGMGGTTEGTTTPTTTGLITGAFMATHMVATTVATTTGLMEDSGLASVTKTEEERGPKRAGVRGASNMSPLILSFNTNVALAYIQCR
jgi:hypothetical protein